MNTYFKAILQKVCLLPILSFSFIATSNINAIDFSQLFEDKADSDFYKNYTLIEEIGEGTYSTVYLSKNNQNEFVAVKKYAIEDDFTTTFFLSYGVSPETFIRRVAQNELEIGRQVDHPNIVKIRDVYFEHSAAYVVMDYIEGKPLPLTNQFPAETRIALMQQFLSAIEHLLLRNIIIDDLWTDNILISDNSSRLTLIDLGGNDIINNDIDLPVNFYLEQIEEMLLIISKEASSILERCSHLLPSSLRKEMLCPRHVRALVSWVEALQKEVYTSGMINNTICKNSTDELRASFAKLQSQFPDHISFSTAQQSQFLPYPLIAEAVLKKFSPGKYPKTYFKNVHFLRYPFENLPKSLESLFKILPMTEDYDTSSSHVSDLLLSVSPSLNEDDSEESAWSIFMNNDRKIGVAYYIHNFFEVEKVSPAL